MAGDLVPQIKIVVLSRESEVQCARLESRMLLQGASLAFVWFEIMDCNAEWCTRLTPIAVGAVREHAASAEPLCDQIGVRRGVNNVAWGGNLRACLPLRHIAAFIRCRRVKLQCLQGEVRQVCHGCFGQADTSWSQYRGLKFQVSGPLGVERRR